MSDFDKIISLLENLEKRILDSTTDALNKSAELVEESAKSKLGSYQPGWPPIKKGGSPLLKTGGLRGSIARGTASGDTSKRIKISANSFYAGFHEYGAPGANIPKREFLKPALEENREKIVELIGEEVRKAVEQA